MPAPRKYPNELRERSQRMVGELMEEDAELSLTGACKQVGARLGIPPDTLRNWARQELIDTGKRPGTTSAEASKIRELEREVRELKRANEILLAASSFFARELDPRLPW